MNFDSVGRVMLLEFQVRVEIWVFNMAICELVWPGSLLMKDQTHLVKNPGEVNCITATHKNLDVRVRVRDFIIGVLKKKACG